MEPTTKKWRNFRGARSSTCENKTTVNDNDRQSNTTISLAEFQLWHMQCISTATDSTWHETAKNAKGN